jgi:hypothetical protein
MDFHDEKTLIEQLANDVWCRLGPTPSWTQGSAPTSRHELWAYCEAFSRDVFKNKSSQAAFTDLQRKVVEAEAKLFTETSRFDRTQRNYEERVRGVEGQLLLANDLVRTLEDEKHALEARLPDLELAEKYKKLVKALGENGDKYIDALIKRGIPKLTGERDIKVER